MLAEVADDDELHGEHADTFADEGVMTMSAGVVVGLSDGTAYR